MVLVAVGTNKREIDVLGLTFGQKSITGSGGYSHEDVMDVMKIMKSKKWDIEKMITHEYHLGELSKAIEKAVLNYSKTALSFAPDENPMHLDVFRHHK